MPFGPIPFNSVLEVMLLHYRIHLKDHTVFSSNSRAELLQRPLHIVVFHLRILILVIEKASNIGLARHEARSTLRLLLHIPWRLWWHNLEAGIQSSLFELPLREKLTVVSLVSQLTAWVPRITARGRILFRASQDRRIWNSSYAGVHTLIQKLHQVLHILIHSRPWTINQQQAACAQMQYEKLLQFSNFLRAMSDSSRSTQIQARHEEVPTLCRIFRDSFEVPTTTNLVQDLQRSIDFHRMYSTVFPIHP
jgi:hypothetical protein